MTEKQKAAKFNKIQKALWDMAVRGNLLQSTLASVMIRQFKIEAPNGEDPGQA